MERVFASGIGEIVMKKLFFEIERDGFYGTYYENPTGSDCTVIGLFGDDPNDYMAYVWYLESELTIRSAASR